MKNKKNTKRKIKYKNIILFLGIIFIISYMLFYIIDFKLKNIYILNNNILSDQYIIDKAKIQNYPSIFKISSSAIKKRLEKDILISSAKVYRKGLFTLYIEITENRPLFFYKDVEKTVLSNSDQVNQTFDVPALINYVPDVIYDDLCKCIYNIETSVFNKISEIKYDPNEVDEERFLLTMSDGNYVYINITNFKKLNNYIDIVSKFDNTKGILYLDSGEFFQKTE